MGLLWKTFLGVDSLDTVRFGLEREIQLRDIHTIIVG